MRLDFLKEFDFFAGVPDSQLRPLCDYLTDRYGTDPQHHVIAANEGNAVALAAGYHLATGKVPVVYLQNSGEGNIINPIASLLNEAVYAIPCLFIIGWRGEPGIHDEPQHIFQGGITQKLLEDMEISAFIIDRETTKKELEKAMAVFQTLWKEGKQTALIIRKGAFEYDKQIKYRNKYSMQREEAIRHITEVTQKDPVISTTGKISRELFEIRSANGQSHETDFLTVGSMGHSSSIAFGIALQRPEKKIWIIDGDGAVLMHMGAMALMGAYAPKNIVHIVINNGAHESVGGMPTVAEKIDMVKIAQGCGYLHAVCVDNLSLLDRELEAAKHREEISFIEVRCAIGSRADLGRPDVSPKENMRAFCKALYENIPEGE